MNNKILVIEDEKMILDMLKTTLTAKGYEVLTALSAKKAIELLAFHPDLILLDICMPGMDGLDFCMQVREHISCPILFLTARVTEQDKINGLLAGGDDYTTKPFCMEELLARITAHLRREKRRASAAEVQFQGKLIIDYGSCTVFGEKEEICFSKKEFEIIRFLSKNPGMPLKKAIRLLFAVTFLSICVFSIGTVLWMNRIQSDILDRKEFTVNAAGEYEMEPFTDDEAVRYYSCEAVMFGLPVAYLILGMAVSSGFFYKMKLQEPIEELGHAILMTAENDLDFSISYSSEDELGSLCRSMERMRQELCRSNEKE